MKKTVIHTTMTALIMISLLAGCGGKDQVQNSADPAAKEDRPSSVVEETKNEISSEGSSMNAESTAEPPVVFFTADITAEGLVRIYEQLDWQPTGNVAVKISTGEPPASNYLRPDLCLMKEVTAISRSDFLSDRQITYCMVSETVCKSKFRFF